MPILQHKNFKTLYKNAVKKKKTVTKDLAKQPSQGSQLLSMTEK